MKRPTTRSAVLWLLAILVWLGAGLSLGWYYTFTYYGHAGWPMPLVEFCTALILYYFSVLNVDTVIQAIHWLIVFPVTGILWATSLWILAPRFRLIRPKLVNWVTTISLCSLPIVIAGPPMSLIAARSDSGLDWHRMLDVALRHGFVSPPTWLTPMYFALGLTGFACQVAAYHRAFAGPVIRGLMHALCAAVLTVLTACVAGALISIPLRYWLE